MCGRTTSTMPLATLAQVLHVDEVRTPELPFSWNVAPTQLVYAAVRTSGGRRALAALRWGLVPSWAKSLTTGTKRSG